MIEQQGRIVRTEGGLAWVQVGALSGCAACDSGRGCGAGIFGRLVRRRPIELPLPGSPELSVGQAVVLGIAERAFLRMVMLLYGWPLMAGLAVAWLCHQIAGGFGLQQGWLDLAALAGLILGAAWPLARWRGRTALGQLAGEVSLLGVEPRRDCLAPAGAGQSQRD